MPAELRSHPLLLALPPEARREAEAAFLTGDVGADELLVEEGENDSAMTVVLGGEVSVSVGDPPVDVARLGAGELVGEMALLTTVKRRSATVRTLTDCRLAVMDEAAWRHLRMRAHPLCDALEVLAIRSMARRIRDIDARMALLTPGEVEEPASSVGLIDRLSGVFTGRRRGPAGPRPDPYEAMRRSPAFRAVKDEALRALADAFSVEGFPAGAPLTEQGVPGEDAWIVASGWVDVHVPTHDGRFARVAVLSDGDLFGLVSLVDGGTRTATCVTAAPSWLLRIHREDFIRLFEAGGPAARGLRAAFLESLADRLRLANTQVETAVHRQRMAGLDPPLPFSPRADGG